MPEDLLLTCFGEGVTPSAETNKHCRICYNTACSRSIGNGTQWARRIADQAERLFKPKLADPEDPRFDSIRKVDFPSAVAKEARKEIANQRGDWTQPTETETALKATMMIAQPEPVAADAVVLETITIAGSKRGEVYTVTLVEREGQRAWECTCKAFLYGKTLNGCKHIQQAKAKAPAEKPIPETQKQVYVDPLAGRKAYTPPRAINTSMPSGGIMLDGPPATNPLPRPTATPRQVVDPWAPAPPKPATIPVGGRVVLGGTGDKKDK